MREQHQGLQNRRIRNKPRGMYKGYYSAVPSLHDKFNHAKRGGKAPTGANLE